MELGALVCTPRQMACSVCPLRHCCFARAENRIAEFPMLPPRAAATERRFMAFVAQKEDRFLVRQRPGGAVNAHLWEFPNMEIALEDDPSTVSADSFQIVEGQPVCRVRHSITRYRVLLEAYHAQVTSGASGNWKTISELKRLPFASAHRKILASLSQPPSK